ncbi:BTAD domain-containing putative transcriptional regulator [Nonomuraea sp. NPDC046802]|uniref:BTAD domain-containing putative transcriptional regulator n=1 Tax=Nonomuraea sp. NPDC046802 TaxID=3154919 RepID=UPI0033EEEDF2
MRVGVLGPLQITAHGLAVEVGGARVRALLIRLALDAGNVVAVEPLTQALWPEDGPADRVHALHSLVSRLRRALPVVIRQAPGGYFLDVPPDAVDALRFERLTREGRQALRDGNPELAAERLRTALGLWRGDALTDVAEAPYAVAAAGRLQELRLATIEDRVAAELRLTHDLAPVVAELEELVTAHPLRERLRGLLMKALHATGRQAEALGAYEAFRVLLAEELGADPGLELRQLHLSLLRAEQTVRGNLRAPLTSFVGRVEERVQLAGQLREGRLVTLVGPGGVGKSRLATKVAGELAAEVPGGVWLVELAPVADPADLAQAIVNALGLADPGRTREQVSRLADALPVAETLIVLDNCEHLIDAVARLVEELLGRRPNLRVLATSREPLGILGEALCPLTPLPSAEGMRLLIERAVAVQPGFTLADDDREAAAKICDRLDGLPLAIELAAARLRYLSVEQLAARLDDRFLMLTGGSRTALPRHRTLRAVVAWSWDLLADGEREAVERLSVFPGSFTPEAAARVCGWRVVEDLADKSLLQFVAGSEPRYLMLETIREYGLERLAETGKISVARAAHAAYFLELAERAGLRLRTVEQLAWIRRLAADRDDLLAAVRFACDTGDAETARRLGVALGWFWTVAEDPAEAAGLLGRVLDVAGDATVAATYLLNTVMSGDGIRARDDGGRLLALATQAGQPAAAMIEAMVALIAGDPAAGLPVIDVGLPGLDPWGRGMLWFIRSFLDGSLGDMEAMARDLDTAATAFRACGERWGLAISLSYLAFARNTLGDFDASVAALEESIGLARDLGVDDGQRGWLATVRSHTGQVAVARSELLEVLAGRPPAHRIGPIRVLLANLARFDGDLDAAARHLEEAAPYRAAAQDASMSVLFLLARGELAVARDEVEAARRDLAQAFTLAAQTRDMPLVAMAGVGVASLRQRAGAPDAAARVLGAAHTLRGGPDARHPDVLRLARDVRAELGERAYREAYAHGRRLDHAVAIAHITAAVTHST